VSGQLHDPATLPPAKEIPVPARLEAGLGTVYGIKIERT
jgi:hypothetical protein